MKLNEKTGANRRLLSVAGQWFVEEGSNKHSHRKATARTLGCIINFQKYLFNSNLILIFDVSNLKLIMILSFGNKETEKIWNDERVFKLPFEIQNIGRRNIPKTDEQFKNGLLSPLGNPDKIK